MKIGLKLDTNGIILIFFLLLQSVQYASNKINIIKRDLNGHGIHLRNITEKNFNNKNNTSVNDLEKDVLNHASIFENNMIQMPFNSITSDNENLNNLYQPSIYIIESMTSNFYVDPTINTCDVKVFDTIKFSFHKPTDRLDYIMISKKTPLYGFTPKIISKANIITDYEIYEDSSFKQRVYYDSDGKRIAFRDRWLISIQLLKPVKEVEIGLEYYMQRAILIDNIREANFLKFSLINPNSFNIDQYQIIVNLLNFQKLKPEDINIPNDGLVKINGKDNIQIITKRKYDKHSEIEVYLSLPYELLTCDGNIVNYVFYGLVFTSITFVILSLITIGFLYKE